MPMTDLVRAEFEQLLAEVGPRLHRYCARMTGSAVDGEDIVQDAMIKALDALATVGPIDLNIIAADEPSEDGEEIAVVSLRTFLGLPALQRSAVILKDVLGHSIEEISSITGATPAAAKSALQRGRVRLRELAAGPEDVGLPPLSEEVWARLAAYVNGFRTGDFDAVRQMLADDVKLDLVGKFSAKGKGSVGQYYGGYAAAAQQWAYAPGVVEGRPAMLVFDRKLSLETPAYFVALTFEGGRVAAIHDFLFARYAMEGADLLRWNSDQS
jgi:RNA polymerase sigma-70 factor (ECF subfamily)